MNSASQRKRYLDTLKFISILLVFIGHFIGYYNGNYNSFWNTAPTQCILASFTAKMGVAFFAVILGYLSYKKRKDTFFEYCVRRYSYFFFVGLFINIVFVFYQDYTIVDAFKAAIHIGKDIYPHFWCMRYFLVASMISYFLATKDSSVFERIFLILLLYYVDMEWSAICLLGTLIPDIKELKYFENNIVKLVLFIICFCLIQGPEDERVHFFCGVYAVIVICIIENSPSIEKFFSNKFISFLGTNTLAILLIHTVVYEVVGSFIFSSFLNPIGFGFILGLIICFAITCLVSIPITYLFNSYNKLFSYALNKIKSFCLKSVIIHK